MSLHIIDQRTSCFLTVMSTAFLTVMSTALICAERYGMHIKDMNKDVFNMRIRTLLHILKDLENASLRFTLNFCQIEGNNVMSLSSPAYVLF